MRDRADIAIIGAGAAGLFAAIWAGRTLLAANSPATVIALASIVTARPAYAGPGTGKKVTGIVLLSAGSARPRCCERCGHDWTDVWSATCDDDCPSCGSRHYSPYKSEDVEDSDGDR